MPFLFTTRLPAHTSDPGASTFISPEPSLWCSTTTPYWAPTLSNDPTITHSTTIQTGVLVSDNPNPNQNAFAHKTGAVIGVALAGTLAVIISVIIVFLMCRRYHYQRNGRRGTGGSDLNSVNEGEGSRENFLRQEVDAITGGDEGPPSSWAHGVGAAGPLGAMMMEKHGSGPASFPSYSYYDGGGSGGGTGATSGGYGSGTSAESAGMYPPQTHAHTTSYPGMDPYPYIPTYTTSANIGMAVPMGPPTDGISSSDDMMRSLPSPPPPLHLHDSTLWPSLPPSHMGSPTQPFASYLYPPQQPQNYSHPYQNAPRAATSGGIGSVGSGQSDPFGDAHAATAISSLSGHGHPYPSSEAIVSSACLGGSSSQGHLISSGGHGSGTGGAGPGGGGAMTSSSGHGAGMSVGGIVTSSSGHGHGGLGPAGSKSRSKNNSPTTEMKKFQLPPSSFVPPLGATAGSSESSGSQRSKSSRGGLLGKFRSISRGVKSKEREKESERRRSLQTYSSDQPGAVGGSSGEGSAIPRRSTSMLTTMPMGHGATLGHTILLHHHGPPSSLLNPPNAIPIPPPGSPITMQRNDVVSTVPSIQYPESSMRMMGEYHPHPYAIGPDYGLPNELETEDMWAPPPIGSDLLRSPSPVSTEASSYVEGLLNPRMLPGGGGGGSGGGNNGSGISGTTKHLASRGGTHSALSGGIFRREWSTGSGVVLSSRSLGLAPGQGHGDGLGMYDDEGGGGSVMSLRDNLDYSRPISGNAVVDRMRSTTTFGTDIGGDGRSAATSPSPVPTSGGGAGVGVGDVMTGAGVSSRGIVAGTLPGSKRGSGGDVEEEDEGRMR